MNKGDLYIDKRTGRRVRIEEVLPVQSGKVAQYRFRLSGSTEFLSVRQVRALYDEITTTPAAASQTRRA